MPTKTNCGTGIPWSAEELDIGGRAYKLGGAPAVRLALPHRSDKAIDSQVRVQKAKGRWFWDRSSRISEKDLAVALNVSLNVDQQSAEESFDPDAPLIDTTGLMHRLAMGIRPARNKTDRSRDLGPMVCHYCGSPSMRSDPKDSRKRIGFWLIPLDGLPGKYECKSEAACSDRILRSQKSA